MDGDCSAQDLGLRECGLPQPLQKGPCSLQISDDSVGPILGVGLTKILLWVWVLHSLDPKPLAPNPTVYS